jgi:hypothetical protein
MLNICALARIGVELVGRFAELRRLSVNDQLRSTVNWCSKLIARESKEAAYHIYIEAIVSTIADAKTVDNTENRRRLPLSIKT